MEKEKTYFVLGLMSGSSLDGLDIAYCRIVWQNEQVLEWELLKAETLEYSSVWQTRLSALPEQDALTFAKTNVYFGYYMAELVLQFIQKHSVNRIDFIASHGHTIFHDPSRRYTIQIGDGAALAAITGYNVISDFRAHDVALSGEGAPLAPIADAYLFNQYELYLNIGGIANISARIHSKRWVAFDVAPANQVLNYLANLLMVSYDDNGNLARSGKIDQAFLMQLQEAAYYNAPYPKSMANEWIRAEVLPLYRSSELSLEDKLATACELVAIELAKSLSQISTHENWSLLGKKILVSGGGVYNGYLIERIQFHLSPLGVEIIIPDSNIIQFKESLLMAVLGVLRMEGIPNSWKSVTAAKRDTVNGALNLGWKNNII